MHNAKPFHTVYFLFICIDYRVGRRNLTPGLLRACLCVCYCWWVFVCVSFLYRQYNSLCWCRSCNLAPLCLTKYPHGVGFGGETGFSSRSSVPVLCRCWQTIKVGYFMVKVTLMQMQSLQIWLWGLLLLCIIMHPQLMKTCLWERLSHGWIYMYLWL